MRSAVIRKCSAADITWLRPNHCRATIEVLIEILNKWRSFRLIEVSVYEWCNADTPPVVAQQLAEGTAKVQMTTLDVMAADARGLTHGGFYFGKPSE